MAYTLEDEDGHLGNGPSINGLRELKAFMGIQKGSYPAMRMLLTHGMTHLTLPLATECRALAKLSKLKDVTSTLEEMAASASKAKGVVILAA